MFLKECKETLSNLRSRNRCCSFCSVSLPSDDQAKIVEGAGGVTRVVEVLTANSTQENVQELASALLHTLTCDDNKKRNERWWPSNAWYGCGHGGTPEGGTSTYKKRHVGCC